MSQEAFHKYSLNEVKTAREFHQKVSGSNPVYSVVQLTPAQHELVARAVEHFMAFNNYDDKFFTRYALAYMKSHYARPE